jgi:hypothetical protein
MKNELPKLIDLVKDVSYYEESDKLNFLLNQEPPKNWIKEHPYIKGHKYIPIDKVEYLLRKIFKQYRIEIKDQGNTFNGVFVTVRVHYLNIITNEWSYHDGIGAINLQLRKQTSEEKRNNTKVEFNTVNINNGALSMAYPLAKTLAIKDACDMFGKLFGADLNRRDTIPARLDVKLDKEQEIKKLLENPSLEVSNVLRSDIEAVLKYKQKMHYDDVIKALNKQITKP